MNIFVLNKQIYCILSQKTLFSLIIVSFLVLKTNLLELLKNKVYCFGRNIVAVASSPFHPLLGAGSVHPFEVSAIAWAG